MNNFEGQSTIGHASGIGDTKKQADFLRRNESFVLECQNLNALENNITNRTCPTPSQDEIDKMSQMSKDNADRIEFEDKANARRIAFYLGRMAVDDFGEIITLAGNGYGFGALKILRGMYERVVTAKYLVLNPSETRIFIEQSAIDKWKLWRRTIAALPCMSEKLMPEQVRLLQDSNNSTRKKRKIPICQKCKQPMPDSPWTRKGIDAMAQEVDPDLYQFYGQFYLEGTAQSHANMLGMENRMERTEAGWKYKDASENEQQLSLMLGHYLLLNMLEFENTLFGFGLNSELEARKSVCQSIWNPTKLT